MYLGVLHKISKVAHDLWNDLFWSIELSDEGHNLLKQSQFFLFLIEGKSSSIQTYWTQQNMEHILESSEISSIMISLVKK